MHYSPDATRLVYTGNQGTPLPRTVVVREPDGRQRVVGEGRSPCWSDRDEVQAVSLDDRGNVLVRARAPGWELRFTVSPGGNQHTCSSDGRWAVGLTNPRRIVTSWGEVIEEASDPALSPNGDWFAWVEVNAEGSGLNAIRVDDLRARTGREVYRGAPVDLRFGWGSTALTWVDNGEVFGIAAVDNPQARFELLTYRGFRCGWPRALWDGSRLWVGMAADLGHSSRILLAEWDSAARGEHRGFIVDDSTGSGFDLCVTVNAEGWLLCGWLDPAGRLRETAFNPRVAAPIVIAHEEPPPPPPETLPDVPFVVEQGGVIEDVWPWLIANYPVSPDGSIIRIPKSDEISADGHVIGEWWDVSDEFIGHLEDAGTGFRLYQGHRYSAEQWVALGQPVPWASLRIARNTFKDGARVWLPRRCVTGWSLSYRTDITWTHGYVDPNVPVTIRVEVGHGRTNGREVRLRQFYDPRRRDSSNPKRKAGDLEVNDIGPSGWITHAVYKDDENGIPRRVK